MVNKIQNIIKKLGTKEENHSMDLINSLDRAWGENTAVYMMTQKPIL